jgi:hypothetical protein
MPSPKRTTEGLKELLDEKFAAHEHRSNLAISELKNELVTIVHAQDKKNEERHAQTLGVLSAHGSRLELHDLRIERVEEKAKELHDDRKLVIGDWKRWVLGVVAAVLVAWIMNSLKGK